MTDVRCHYALIHWKDEDSVLINDLVVANYSVSRLPFCPPSWNVLSDLCKSSATHVRCHYAQFSEKKRSLHIIKWLSYSEI